VKVAAADWSGAVKGEQRHLWLAEADAASGRLTALAPMTRQQAGDRLLALADADADLVVGLDFGFSLPGWFLDREGITAASDLWADNARLEGWLAACAPPFWGRPGRPRPVLPGHWRLTELATTPRPKSVFQIGGSGAVGTASLRGMPVLDRLRRAGFSVWPFDPPVAPLVLEVWPRLAIGQLVKSRPSVRQAWLATHAVGAIGHPFQTLIEGSDDAFDAAAAALALTVGGQPPLPPPVGDPTIRREGWIWGVPLPCGKLSP
jgi:hypothetical protein